MAENKYWDHPVERQPDFENLLSVLKREVPSSPTLFEFGLNVDIFNTIVGDENAQKLEDSSPLGWFAVPVEALRKSGYDYYLLGAGGFSFTSGDKHREKSVSLNEGAVITDRASFEKYEWLDPDDFPPDNLDLHAAELPAGMKLMVRCPGGVLENVIKLVGFEDLCMMMLDDIDLVGEIFTAVGSRLVKYYENCVNHPAVGAIVSNDDWGFKTQTMFPPETMRKFVFPWHRKIVQTAHGASIPAILHSCGQLEEVMDDVIDDMKYDGKHSWEDSIIPVEQAYERWGSRIAIIGGIDVDYLVRSTPDEIYNRSKALLDLTAKRGGYALGSGNSIPGYIPQENYFAMTAPARECK